MAIMWQKFIASEVMSRILHLWSWHSDDQKANLSLAIKNLTFLRQKFLNHFGDSKCSLSWLRDSSGWVRLELACVLYSYQHSVCWGTAATVPCSDTPRTHTHTHTPSGFSAPWGIGLLSFFPPGIWLCFLSAGLPIINPYWAGLHE